MKRYVSGFTIVELIVVIIVLAILAIIGSAVYNGTQARANTSAIQADLTQIARIMELHKAKNRTYIHDPVDSPDLSTVSATIRTQLSALPIRISRGAYSTNTSNLLYVASTDGSKWGLLAVPKRGETWYVSYAQSTPAPYSQLSSQPIFYAYPGNGFGSIAQTLGIPLDQSAYWNVYDKNNGFKAWVD